MTRRKAPMGKRVAINGTALIVDDMGGCPRCGEVWAHHNLPCRSFAVRVCVECHWMWNETDAEKGQYVEPVCPWEDGWLALVKQASGM